MITLYTGTPGSGKSLYACSKILDTFKRLKLSTIINYTRKGWYISRWKTYLINDGNREHSVVWGSPKSDFRLRIY